MNVEILQDLPLSRILRRYSAFFMGWCQAFGLHELDFDEEVEIRWLFGEDRLGLILSPELKRIFYREILAKEQARMSVTPSSAKIGEALYQVRNPKDRQGLRAMIEMFLSPGDTHMFLSYHFCYPPGTRIVTFTKKSPLGLLYKEIHPLKVTIADPSDAPETDLSEDNGVSLRLGRDQGTPVN
jgi:hypothetical protein